MSRRITEVTTDNGLSKSRVTVPSTSKSNRRKGKKFKSVPKVKQQWQVKQQKRNWLELPTDVMANILYRVGVLDILENAQKVCTAWYKICMDPALWRVIYMDNFSDPSARPLLERMCKHAVDRSQGQLVDITIVDFGTHELVKYIADRSSKLKRLAVDSCYGELYDGWTEIFEKVVLLEELSICFTEISKEDIEGAGRCCPMLKTLKASHRAYRFLGEDYDEESLRIRDESAIAIGKNLHELRHLEIIGDSMSNTGLQVILDGCPHLELLDLRRCFNVDLKGDMGKRCSQQIKCLKLPTDSIKDCPYYGSDRELYDDILDFDDEYHRYIDYEDEYGSDDDTDFDLDHFTDFEDLEDMLTFMAMVGIRR